MPIAVIMPAFNAERFIEQALRSLLRERNAVSINVIVIDDGSTDGTRPVVERVAAANPEVRLLRNPRKGIASARNTGLDHLPDDCLFVAFLDADDISAPYRLERQSSRLAADGSADVLYGLLRMFKALDDATLEPAEDSPTRVIRGPYLQASMYRRAVFDAVGRFDETYHQGDDTDFVLKVIEHPFRLALEAEVAAYYRRHDANVTLNVAERQREFARANMMSAVRRQRRGGAPLPAVFAELLASPGDIEHGFGS